MSDDTNIAEKLAKMPSVWWARLMELAPRIDVLTKEKAAAELAPLLAQVPGLLHCPDQSTEIFSRLLAGLAGLGMCTRAEGYKSVDDVLGDVSAELRHKDRFKSYVHSRLDAAGVPTHPEGPHSKEGCRVGDRLDILIGERDQSTATHSRLRELALKAAATQMHADAWRVVSVIVTDIPEPPTPPPSPRAEEARVNNFYDKILAIRDLASPEMPKYDDETHKGIYFAARWAGANECVNAFHDEFTDIIHGTETPPSPRAEEEPVEVHINTSGCTEPLTPETAQVIGEAAKKIHDHYKAALAEESLASAADALASKSEDEVFEKWNSTDFDDNARLAFCAARIDLVARIEALESRAVADAILLAKYRAGLVAHKDQVVRDRHYGWIAASEAYENALRLLDSTFGAKRDGAGEVGRDTDLPPRGVPTGGWKDYPDCHMIMSSCCFRPDCRRCDEFKRHSSHRFYGLLLALTEYFREGRPYPKHFEWVVEHFDPRKNACAAEETWAKYQSTLERMRKQENEGEE